MSKKLLKDYYEGRVVSNRLLIDKIITSYSANNEVYSPTIGGVLFFCEFPERYIPEATIICTRFKGDSGRDIIRTEELIGPITQLAESAFELLIYWLKEGYHLQGVYLKESLPIPKEALREAIINALIHRKYSIPGSIKIALYDHHCEIFSPGCFPGFITISHLGDGTTYLRNPVIAKLARKVGLVEKLGTGIRLIFDSCKAAGLRKPQFVEGGDFVKVTFFFEPERTGFEEEEIIKFIEMRGEIKIKELMDFQSISRNTATRRLNNLIKKGKIVRRGKGPSVCYFLNM